jgi:hypothetical protein
MFSPISIPNLRIKKKIYVVISFSTGKQKKKCFGPIRSLFSFSAAQTKKIHGKNSWKKFVKQMVKTLMNS